MSDALKVGDLVTGEFFRGEKPLTYVDAQTVMVQITPAYEQAYYPHQVHKVESKPEPCETCNGSGQVAIGPWGVRPQKKACPDCDGRWTLG